MNVGLVGAGPSGLFLSYLLLSQGHHVSLYEGGSGVAKKYLIAGKSGLNIGNDQPIDYLAEKFGQHQDFFAKLLTEFSVSDLRKFYHDLGFETFIGTTGRVFPEVMKSGEIVRKWLDKLKSYPGFTLHLNHRLIEIKSNEKLCFLVDENKQDYSHSFWCFAMGGGSYQQTGSDGSFMKVFQDIGIGTTKLSPMNCGFEVSYSPFLLENVIHKPLKNITVRFRDKLETGELMISDYGLEGTPLYSLAHHIVAAIDLDDYAMIKIDLKPTLSESAIIAKIKAGRGKNTWSNFLRKVLNMDKVQFNLLKESSDTDDFSTPDKLAQKIKSLPIKLIGYRDIDEAISTSGGVQLKELSPDLNSVKYSNFYFMGEMLDWEAPTGGYLLHGCFATAYRVFLGLEKVKE